MTRKFIMRSSLWDGHILLEYHTIEGYICAYSLEAEMSLAQIEYFIKHFPISHAAMMRFADRHPDTITIEEVKREVPTFDLFWNEYRHKVDRLSAEKEWNKLSDADKIQCLDSIKGYHNYLKRKVGQEIIYPVRYIKYRRFETNYYTLK